VATLKKMDRKEGGNKDNIQIRAKFPSAIVMKKTTKTKGGPKLPMVAIVKKIDMREKWSKVSLVVVVKKTDSFVLHFMVVMNIQIEKKGGALLFP